MVDCMAVLYIMACGITFGRAAHAWTAIACVIICCVRIVCVLLGCVMVDRATNDFNTARLQNQMRVFCASVELNIVYRAIV
eukprot:11225338-Lingulodinium_polyedra.AAC.1